MSDQTEETASEQIVDKEVRTEFHADVVTDGDKSVGTTTGSTVERVTFRQAASEADDMPLPTDPKTVFLGGLFLLAMLVVLYVAAELILPIILAIVLKLLLQPLVRLLESLHVPRSLGAIVAVLLVVAALGGTISALAGPAASWASKLPEAIPQIQSQLYYLKRPIESARQMMGRLDAITGGELAAPAPASASAPAAPSRAAHILGSLFAGTATLTAGLLTTLVILFYVLVSGETFMRRLVEILPRFRDKRQAVEIAMHVEKDVSAYLLTVTCINAVVGVATGLVMWACGVANPVLWGAVAFVLNFVPILGAMVGIGVFLLASVLTLGVTWWALLPVGLYFAIHVAEGEFLTPMFLARRFTINPVAVILALVFWYWMWGVPGAILAVPMLAVIKIVCDDIRPLRAFGHFLEG